MNNLSLLTISRFFAAIFVVFMHFSSSTDLLWKIFWREWGVAVSYFFVLSGFILFYSNYKNQRKWNFSLYKYYIRRIARIYPLLVISFLFVFFVNLYWYNQNIRISNVLLSITWLQWFIPKYALSFNAPSWTISSEILFYTLFPLLLRIFINNSFRKIGLIVLSIYIFSQSFILLQVFSDQDFIRIMNQKFWHDFIYYFPFFHISNFLIGMLSARAYIESVETSKKWNEWYFFIFFIWLILMLILIHKNIMIHNGFLAPLFASIIFLLARLSNQYIWGLTTKIWVLLGESSYAIYILQVPVDMILKKILNFTWLTESWYYFIIYLVILVWTSILSFLFLESPVRKFVTRKLILNR